MKKKEPHKYDLSDLESLTDENLMTVAESGIAYGTFNEMAVKTPLSMGDWASFLHLSERTMHRYRKNQLTFDPLHSERILELVLLFRKGQEIFSTEENFTAWLNAKNIALGGKAPLQLLGSSLGIGLVKDELSRIEHGILA